MSRRFAFDLAFVGALCGSVCLGEQGTSTIENVLRQEQADAPVVLLLEGAAGAPEYKANFHRQVDLWSNVARVASAILIKIPDTNCIGRSDLDQFRASLNGVRSDGAAALWLVMIGHGTFDGSEAKFNLRGPDLSATELAELLRRFTRPVVVINTASASGGFLGKLSGTNRVVVTATRSGHEQNFARFGLYLAESWTDQAADLDRDGAVSLLEAFLNAARRVADFYKTEGRLATEHALLDDNGDGLGTQADWFSGLQAVKKPTGGFAVDGFRARRLALVLSNEDSRLPAEIRARRDALEQEIERLREAKAHMPESEYLDKLELILIELAKMLEVGR